MEGRTMATPIDLLDPPAVMSYGGLVDASTAEGQVEEAADWAGAIAGMHVVNAGDGRDAVVDSGERTPVRHMAHITRRRGAYTPAR
jgi:hypothetical protein